MSDPIHSSSWTGPIEQPTYGIGRSSVSSDYQRLLRLRRAAEAVPPELRRLGRRSAFLLLSPLALAVAYWTSRSIIPAAPVQDFSGLLSLWGVATVLATILLLQSRPRLLRLKEASATLGLLATLGCAAFYIYASATSYAAAMPSVRERTFEIYRCHGRCRYVGGYFVHQRADGTTVEGEYVGPPLPYGRCALVQRLNGDYGFSWVRVLERSRAGEQLAWPIRREDCFGTMPVSSLKG